MKSGMQISQATGLSSKLSLKKKMGPNVKVALWFTPTVSSQLPMPLVTAFVITVLYC
jgi:hypothetical protein